MSNYSACLLVLVLLCHDSPLGANYKKNVHCMRVSSVYLSLNWVVISEEICNLLCTPNINTVLCINYSKEFAESQQFLNIVLAQHFCESKYILLGHLLVDIP